MAETGDLAGRVAVVTGAGGGFGRAIGERLQRSGARIVAVDVEAALDEHGTLHAQPDPAAAQVEHRHDEVDVEVARPGLEAAQAGIDGSIEVVDGDVAVGCGEIGGGGDTQIAGSARGGGEVGLTATAPPRCAMPCTSACLKLKPASIAA